MRILSKHSAIEEIEGKERVGLHYIQSPVDGNQGEGYGHISFHKHETYPSIRLNSAYLADAKCGDPDALKEWECELSDSAEE